MTTDWQATFRDRMRRFEKRREPGTCDASVSIKIRVTSGCFHREHSRGAYKRIDEYLSALQNTDDSFDIQEHESGPEILVYLAITTAGITLAKSVVDLITAIIKARSDGIKKGDTPSAPLELIVRRVGTREEYREEAVLRIGHEEPVDSAKIEEEVNKAIRKLMQGDERNDG